MLSVSGYIWVKGNSKPIFVKHSARFTESEAKEYINSIQTKYDEYQKNAIDDKTIVICDTIFRLESVEAISLTTCQ